MKIAISILAFIFTLTITHVTLAAEGKTADKEAAKEEANIENMRALFPPKQPNTALSLIPAKTELQEPAYFAKISSDKVNLKWKNVEGADCYHVQVATDPNFKWIVAEEFFVRTNSFEVANLEGGKHYFWRVNVVKENNEPTHRKSGFVASMFETK